MSRVQFGRVPCRAWGDVLLPPHPLTPSDSHPHNYLQPSAIPSMSAIHLITSNQSPHAFVLNHHIQPNYLLNVVFMIEESGSPKSLSFNCQEGRPGRRWYTPSYENCCLSYKCQTALLLLVMDTFATCFVIFRLNPERYKYKLFINKVTHMD